jgi:hypothetical protein
MPQPEFRQETGENRIARLAMSHPLSQTISPGVHPNPGGFSERRQSPRHPLRDVHGTLSWGEGAERVTCAMQVVNISGGGVAALADQVPPADHPVWIRLETGAAFEPLEARLVATSADPSGKHMIRMRFTLWTSIGSILDQFEEHREWERYPAREKRAMLTWSDPDGERLVRGELLNISGGGAAVITDAMLPDSQPVWLTLGDESARVTPVESRLVTISLDASGLQIARLKFVEACPMDLFKLAVHGSL